MTDLNDIKYEIELIEEDKYVMQNMLTCIGNKRKLVNNIKEIALKVSTILSKPKLNIVDGFSGSSVVSRKLSYICENIYCNDMERYAYLMADCFINTPTEKQKLKIYKHIDNMNNIAENGPYIEGIISKLYSPNNTYDIQEGERCFYTKENALIIDTLRKYIEDNVEKDILSYCLVPLLNKASIHTNTAGVFKGFYKKGTIGCFGGNKEVALSRIMKPIKLEYPIWNNKLYNSYVFNKDINKLINDLPNNIDLIYLDPPYNQHPYGSNYFMLNIIIDNKEPINISKVSGIPDNWNKSKYNNRISASDSLKELIHIGLIKSKYILLSYNNEGIISLSELDNILKNYTVEKYEITYDTYKGSRNLKNRNNKIIEIMYLISKN